MPKKTAMAALSRTEVRLQRALDVDGQRMSRGIKLGIEAALKDVRDVMEMERERETIPPGYIRLVVNISTEVSETLKTLRQRQKGSNGTPISYAETVRRALVYYDYIMKSHWEGRKIHVMDPDGRNHKQLVLK